jgi:type I restriction enzyme S subunit
MAAVDERDGSIAAIETRPYAAVAKGFTPFRSRDVIFAKITPCMENGKAALVGDLPSDAGFGSTEFHVLRAGERILPELVHAWVRRPEFRAEAKAAFKGTAGQQRVAADFFNRTPIPVPPLAEQRRIVDLLNRAAGIRRLREAALAKARETIPALFLSLFGDPAVNPMGWHTVSLGEVIADGPKNGLYRPSSDYGSGTAILRIDSFDAGEIHDVGSLRRLRLDPVTMRQFALAPGDIVINRVNSPPQLGKSAIVPALDEPVVFESNMMRLRLDTTRFLPEALIVLLQLPSVQRALTRHAKHAINQSSINQTDVKSIVVPMPPIALQRTFATRLSDLRAIIAHQERALALARDTERALMAHLLG